MRYKIAAILVLLQLAFFAAWAGYEEMLLRTGDSILVKTVPVDPRDLLSGQYLELRYAFSSVESLGIESPGWSLRGKTVWVVLGPQGEFHVLRYATMERPAHLAEGEVALKGVTHYWNQVTFGIERYFVPEGTETPQARSLTVRLRVGKGGNARIETVYVNGEPWP